MDDLPRNLRKLGRPMTPLTVHREAAHLLSEDGENPEYDRALVELCVRLTPGGSHDDNEAMLDRLQTLLDGRERQNNG
jgi:hypothetical protein